MNASPETNAAKQRNAGQVSEVLLKLRKSIFFFCCCNPIRPRVFGVGPREQLRTSVSFQSKQPVLERSKPQLTSIRKGYLTACQAYDEGSIPFTRSVRLF
jgi:hypothetical protein